MNIIKNFEDLAKSPERKKVLDVLEAGLDAIEPNKVFAQNFKIEDNSFVVGKKSFNLDNFDNIFLIGFGKGSAFYGKKLEQVLGEKLKSGYVIDVVDEKFKKINYVLGTHPLPSEQNFAFTKKVVEEFGELSDKDLVLVIICGGGSSLFEYPSGLTLDKIIKVNKALLKSGATIFEMNAVRKHLSFVKGGGLAKILHPARVLGLIFSDVPGNDLATIASAPTVQDPTKIEDAIKVADKYDLAVTADIKNEHFVETPKEEKYFEKVTNIMVLSNLTALEAMKTRASELLLKVSIYSDRLQGEASEVGNLILTKCAPGTMLLAGGETTVKVKGKGVGGRNQELALSLLAKVGQNAIVVSIASDGWDNTEFCGGIADEISKNVAKQLGLDLKVFLSTNDSFNFFKKTGQGIICGRLESNVSDLMLVYKWKI